MAPPTFLTVRVPPPKSVKFWWRYVSSVEGRGVDDMLDTSLATDRPIFDPAASDLTVVPDSSCVPVVAFVSMFCLPLRADCVAYVELMSVPLTWSAVAFTVAKFVVAENVFTPDIVWTPDSLTNPRHRTLASSTRLISCGSAGLVSVPRSQRLCHCQADQ